jgi:hypothetical protein
MKEKDGIPFDGFGAVLEMLQRSDAAFRDKILMNISRRDPQLAQRLIANLRADRRTAPRAREEDSRQQLERSQRAAFTRNYGN